MSLERAKSEHEMRCRLYCTPSTTPMSSTAVGLSGKGGVGSRGPAGVRGGEEDRTFPQQQNEKSRLLSATASATFSTSFNSYKSTAVSYFHGSTQVSLPPSLPPPPPSHRFHSSGVGSNVVFPSCTGSSSVSLALVKYQPTSADSILLYDIAPSAGRLQAAASVTANLAYVGGEAEAGGGARGAAKGACSDNGVVLASSHEEGDCPSMTSETKYRRRMFRRRMTQPSTTTNCDASVETKSSISYKDDVLLNDSIQGWKYSPPCNNNNNNNNNHMNNNNMNVNMTSRLKINVSGQYFETRLGVLDRHPDTLLGDRRKRSQFFDRGKNELFFDRHRPSFEAIFVYYQFGGRLRRPHHVPDDVFLDELLFYQLESDAVEEYKRSQGYTTQVAPLPSNSTLKRLWTMFEYPETSRAAFIVAILSVFMTLVSIVLFCVETLPAFAKTHCVQDEAPNFLDPFFIIETACTIWFTIEAIARFISCPNKLSFFRDFKNVVDVMAIVPYYVTLFNVLSTMSCEGAKSSASLAFLRVIRLVRIFKLTKHSVGLQVLILTFQASLEGLGLFLVALCVCLLVFSSTIYYAELGYPGSQIDSIPDAFWWAIITMTTVGYGDKVPVGPWGKLVGAACAITGVLTLAIPVPIITGHFNRFYAHKTGRGRHI